MQLFLPKKHYTYNKPYMVGMERKAYRLNDGREIHIEPLQATDKDRLTEFYRSMSANDLRWSKAPKDYQIDEKFRYPDYYISLITVYDDKVVGYGEIHKDPQKRDGELTIHIHPNYQGVGLGTSMMIMLVKEATEQKLHSIYLQVAMVNTSAVHLFRKFGFQEQHTTQALYWGEKHDTLHMSKVLNR
jgi:ribosomal protein S18 acetylase RimI-like enzyme